MTENTASVGVGEGGGRGRGGAGVHMDIPVNRNLLKEFSPYISTLYSVEREKKIHIGAMYTVRKESLFTKKPCTLL